MNDAHHADRMEHQRINRTNQLTFDLDKLGKGAVPRGMFRRSPREWGGLTNPRTLEEVFGEDIDHGVYGGP